MELEPPHAALHDVELRQPAPGLECSAREIPFDGWVVSPRAPLERIEAVSAGAPAWRLPVNVHMPELAARYPDLQWAPAAGFQSRIGTLRLGTDFELELAAVLRDGTRLRLARIRGSQSPLEAPTPGLRPLLLTTLGRTGSTWVLHLLGQHPAFAVYRPFEYEPRVGSYWAEIAATLAEPKSYLQAVRPELYGDAWWMGTLRLWNGDESYDRPMESWLGLEQTDELARFAKERIAAFYDRFARTEGKDEAVYFAEKCLPESLGHATLSSLYPDLREVFLVRDFRDMVCSMLAYSEARGSPLFGTDQAPDVEQFVLGDLRADVNLLLESWRRRRDGAFLLRYEDVVTDPRRALGALLADLDVDASDATVERTLREATGKAADDQALHRTSTSFAASIQRWRTELSPDIQRTCEEALGPALEGFGYAA